MTTQENPQILVIGAGPSGLVALKTLRQMRFAAEGVDRGASIGGNWDISSPHSSVYESAHLISSKRMTQFVDHPMPDDYPPYPSHRQVLDYLQGYARRFDLLPHIRLQTTVHQLQKKGAAWQVTLSSAADPRPRTETFDAVVIANGHHSEPLWPQVPGQFAGQQIHSHDYKHHRQLAGRRVLVVGGGNSGCDIAVEAAIHADQAAISMRRGYHFFPKFIRGKPADVVGDRLRRWPLPRSWQRAVSKLVVDWTVGRPEKYGLPQPDHRLFETHPIINSQLPYYAGHGKLRVFPNVSRLEGHEVEFVDGRRAAFDLVIWATGYHVTFPFVDDQLLNVHQGMPRLYLHAFHPTDDTLFVAGMIQPNSGQWQLVDLQAQLIGRFLQARLSGAPAADWFVEQKRTAGLGVRQPEHFLQTPRHRLEVDYFEYRQTLQNLLQKLP